MRQLVAALVLAASVLGLSACSNAGSGFVPASPQGTQAKPNSGYPYL